MTPATSPTPANEPHGLGDYWSLFLVAFGLLLLWLGYSADPGDTAYFFFPWLTQGPTCYLLGALCLIGFVLIGVRNLVLFNRWFTNKAGKR